MGRELRTQAYIGNTVYGTEVHSVNGKAGHVVLSAEDVGALPSDTVIPSLDGYTTEEWVEGQGYLTEHQNINGKQDKSNLVTTISAQSTDYQYPSAKCVYDAIENISPGGGDSPVQSVNGKTGAVVLDAEDVGALPDSTVIPSLDGYATQAWVGQQGYLTQHQDISGKADKSEIPTKTSDLTNDSGYLTQHQSLENYALKSEIPTVTNDFTDDYKNKVDSLWDDYQDAITALG